MRCLVILSVPRAGSIVVNRHTGSANVKHEDSVLHTGGYRGLPCWDQERALLCEVTVQNAMSWVWALVLKQDCMVDDGWWCKMTTVATPPKS